ncbi:TetR/AcrR family transcriptional regulator [Streptomyces sp. NPDC047017]|uniref:TetR/AcrR family transcriptional regulator n=1 Tax=Streptomyces sp. NPDC047017 TaxID=3155024 RepID=UPI0033DD0643
MAKNTSTAAPEGVGEPGGGLHGRRVSRNLRLEAAVNAAFALAEREGLAGLTMRRLAQEIDVDVTALYRLFRDKDELVLALCERTIEMELDEIGDLAPTESWQDVLRRVAEVTWRVQTRFPAITELTFARTTGGPAERQMVELLLGCFARAGLDPTRAVLLYRTFIDTALGLCAGTAALHSLQPEVRTKDHTTWTRVYSHLSEAKFPVTRAHTDALSAVDDKAIYDTAVEAVLSTAESWASRSRGV